jgi:hypothetical protein
MKFTEPPGLTGNPGKGWGSIRRSRERRRRGTKAGRARPYVIRSELRISYYAALINGHVCGFFKESRMKFTEPPGLTGNPEEPRDQAVCSS